MNPDDPHPHLAEREVLVCSPDGNLSYVPCRVVNRDGEYLKVEMVPYDRGYKLWARRVYVRQRQPHADAPPWPEEGHA